MRRIKSLTVQGFRGFNKLNETLKFHDKLTLIAGPNSYGKTSISEALEWLLYGVTSKVSDATSNKSEYAGSYRNVHFPETETPFVEAAFILEDGSEAVYRGELQDDDTIQRYLNGKSVENWDWELDAVNDPRPFVLQHSLKNLLLTSPSDRYQRFTKLIGEEDLSNLQSHFIALSTGYHIPGGVEEFLNSFSEFEKNISKLQNLEKIYKIYNKNDFNRLPEAVLAECRLRISNKNAEPQDVLAELKEIRGNAVGKIFDKQLRLERFSPEDEGDYLREKRSILSVIAEKFIKDYLDLAEISTIKHIVRRASFFEYGHELIVKKELGYCPLCGQDVSDEIKGKIKHECDVAEKEAQNSKGLQKQAETISSQVRILQQRLENSYSKYSGRVIDLLGLNEQGVLEQLEASFGIDNKSSFEVVKTAVEEIVLINSELKVSLESVALKFQLVIDSIQASTESPEFIRSLTDELIKYFEEMDNYIDLVNKYASPVSEAGKVLSAILDLQAGTQELSVLIELLEKREMFNKRARIQAILSSVKEVQRQVKDYAAKKLENTVKNDLSNDVLYWYERIKTDGDPDVHFDGFDLPKTKSGSIKDRKISINAKSYGKPLPSAISSLSESKLNALGLAINISNNIKGNPTFGFLVLDDPVQSMDSGHSVQVINMIRSLVDENDKQVILLSHSYDWIKHVRKSCLTLNGYMYEIGSYEQTGPNIQRGLWAAVEERVVDVKALLNKPGGLSSFERQRVAEDFRLLFNELASDIYKAKTGENKNPDDLNATTLRATLIKSNFESADVDSICAAYGALSDSHHKTSYDEPIQRLREYYKLVEKMRKVLDDSLKAGKSSKRKK